MDESRNEHEVSAERSHDAERRAIRWRVVIASAIVLNVAALGVLFWLVLDLRQSLNNNTSTYFIGDTDQQLESMRGDTDRQLESMRRQLDSLRPGLR